MRQHRPSHTPPNWKNVDTLCAAKVVAIHLDPLWPRERFTKIAGRAAAAAPPTRSTVRRMGAVKGGLVGASVDASLARDDSGSPHAAMPLPRGSGTRQGTDVRAV